MHSSIASSPHHFVIPVMGTGFTLDAPLRVGRFGITSTVSLVDDILMEQVRQAWHRRAGLPCVPVEGDGGEPRARRIAVYLNFLKDTVDRQMERLRCQPFFPGSELVRYFEMLPDSPLRARYDAMRQLPPGPERTVVESELRMAAVPGGIDVNIMTKLDRRKNARGEPLADDDTDALAALRGFARSRLRSSVVFSAGLNPRLYGYLAGFDAFYPDARGTADKTIVLKVSDFRSAVVQGTFLAKKGLWVTEFRIESGLNCGGHAFSSGGLLLGPILQTFQHERAALREELFGHYVAALTRARRTVPETAPAQYVTVQGGIGTHQEDRMLRARYGVDRTGWGSPFLMVPEATAVDDGTRALLRTASEADIRLSHASPLGVRFWSLSSSDSERARRGRIAAGKPGSACPKGFLAAHEDLTSVPVCSASRSYQRARLLQLSGAPHEATEQVTEKACICHDLGGGIALLYGIDRTATPAICPGPNVLHFQRTMTLAELVGHIYGRGDVLTSARRPHMFIAELRLNVAYLHELERETKGADPRGQKLIAQVRDNLRDGIGHYLGDLTVFPAEQRDEAAQSLHEARSAIAAGRLTA